MTIDGLLEPKVGEIESLIEAIPPAVRPERVLTAAQTKRRAKARAKRKRTKR